MRFPGFEGEWQENILSDLGSCIGGGTPSSKNSVLWDGDIPWISSSDINENDVNNIRMSRFITQEAIDKSATKFCHAPVILIVSRVGVGKIAHSWTGLCTSQDFTNIVNIKCNSLFLTYLLSHVMKVKASSTQGTSIKGITSSEIKNIKILIPSNNEQEKIATLLTLIDRRIATQNKIIKDLELLKRNVSKRFFEQRLRFKNEAASDFPDWKNKNLEDICHIIGGGTPETNKSEYWNGDIQWFTPTEIKTNYVDKSARTITASGLKNSSAKLLPKGSILLTTRATVGEVAIALTECTTNQGFQSLVVKDGFNNIFIFNWLKEHKYELIKRANGSTFAEVSKSEIEKIPISVPSLLEQIKIANCISTIDNKIEIERLLLKKWETQKKILLANLII